MFRSISSFGFLLPISLPSLLLMLSEIPFIPLGSGAEPSTLFLLLKFIHSPLFPLPRVTCRKSRQFSRSHFEHSGVTNLD
jgi:hypothetical protein